jgi:hypothetical protein
MPRLLPLLFLWPTLALAQAPTPPVEGGPQPRPGQVTPHDAGPANHPPRTDSPDAVHRGTDGSATGLTAPGASGVTPQGMDGDATAGARNPQAPLGEPPPISRPE